MRDLSCAASVSCSMLLVPYVAAAAVLPSMGLQLLAAVVCGGLGLGILTFLSRPSCHQNNRIRVSFSVASKQKSGERVPDIAERVPVLSKVDVANLVSAAADVEPPPPTPDNLSERSQSPESPV